MDKMNAVHRKGPKGLKRQKEMKKKPVRIVQISNPMTVTATASEFKGLVQELTGQDSDMSLLRNYAAAVAKKSAAPPGAGVEIARAAKEYIEDSCPTDCWNVDNNFDRLDEILPSQMRVDRANFVPLSRYNDFSLSGDYAERLRAAGW